MPILEDGQLFERYRVHRWLGSGIAGESYEAEDRILQRKVTLKLIHPWATLSDSARRQFFREMQGVSLLNHPYLATVLDYGETDGRIYVARRFLSSGSLLGTNGRIWFRPPLPVTDAFKYAHQLAQALQYIHQHGYLHGSLTFANLLVLRGPNTENDPDYAPFLVADVGLAHFVRRFGHPRMETLPISAAPEQLGKRATPASDQFALAVLLYFWLSGRPPYLGTASEVEHQKLSEMITPLSVLNPGITLEQESIILRALTVYPEERHASVLAFADALLASLTSANRQYASAPDTFAPQPEAPRELLHTPQNEMPAPAEAAPVEQIQPTASTEEVPTPTQPVPFKAEPYLSALEQLLSVPRTEPEGAIPAETSNSLPVEETAEERASVQEEEEIIFFPNLPETPRVEESILQAEFVHIIHEEAAMPQASKQTGPLNTEPVADAQDSPASERTEEMSAELPGSADALPQNEFPPALEESTFTVWPDKPLPRTEKSLPTALLEELSAPDESAIILSLNGFSPANQEFTPVVAPDESSSTNAEATPTIPLPELSASIDESITVFPLNELDQPGAEITSATLQAEIVPPNAETSIPAELASPQAADTSASPPTPAFETEMIREPHLVPPIQEPHETSGTTYPLLDEATIAPRLIISSPYTSSSFEFLLASEETNIGRAGASDLYLEQDNLTSRHHALLKRVGERVLIFDKHSHNGVFINGQKIEVGRGYELADGDHIGIGNYELIFRSASAGHVSQLI